MAGSRDLNINPHFSLIIAIVATSFASIFIKLCGAPALVIAFFRLALASVILLPFVYFKYFDEFKSLLSLKRLFPAAGAGLFLALHFILWISSLDYTPIANSVIFISTQPIFALILARLFFNEKPIFKMYIAILFAVAGCVFISGGDFHVSGAYIKGDLLAIGGAMFGACYLLTGKWARQKTHIVPYVFVIYAIGAVFIGLIMIVKKLPFSGYANTDYLLFLVLALFPTLIGHSMYNYAVKYLKAISVNMVTVVEPVIASVLAYFIFSEIPEGYFYPGGIFLLTGVYLSVGGLSINKRNN